MDDPESVEAAREAVRAEIDARAAADRALRARDKAIRTAYTLNPTVGPTELGSALGMNANTLRSVIRDLAADRRDAQQP